MGASELTRASLTVGKDGGVEAPHDVVDGRLPDDAVPVQEKEKRLQNFSPQTKT